MFFVNKYNIILIIITALIYIYVSYYIRVNPTFSILQTTLDKIGFDMLNSKLPIVITNKIVDIHDLLHSIFKYQYSFIGTPPDLLNWIKNSHKYMVIKSGQDQKLQIAHPNSSMTDGRYEYVDVVLQKNQVFILPYGWWIFVEGDSEIYMLDDFCSKLISYIL